MGDWGILYAVLLRWSSGLTRVAATLFKSQRCCSRSELESKMSRARAERHTMVGLSAPQPSRYYELAGDAGNEGNAETTM